MMMRTVNLLLSMLVLSGLLLCAALPLLFLFRTGQGRGSAGPVH